ncbi:MAG: flagellar filament capping protein FliD [Myxococcota bacterium]|nr:flagellar filament capping protein FliD [Myxococcota bacterium]
MSFSAGGLVSGLNTKQIVEQLVQIDRVPITKLQSKKTSFNSQISAIGRVRASIDTLITAAKDMDTANEVLALTTTSSNTDAFTGTALGSATGGKYTMEVSQLAVPAKKRSVGFLDSNTAAVQAGTLSFSVKGGAAVDVTISENDTLQDIAYAINSDVEGVSATIIFDGTQSYLSITNDETGHVIGSDPASALKITETYTGTTGSQLGLTEIQAAQNAQLSIDGLTITSETNTVKTALSGVTINLLKKTTAAETLEVKADPDTVTTNITKLVDAYNGVLKVLAKETTMNKATNRDATLASDPTLRGLKATLSQVVTGAVASLSGKTFESLSSIGIKTSTTGNLAITAKDLEAALSKNLTAVADVFTADDGIADMLVSTLKPFTKTDGILSARVDGINMSIKAIDKRVESMEQRLTKYRTQLMRQFTAMESALSLIQQQQSSLSGIV